jgi:hypothetical protein
MICTTAPHLQWPSRQRPPGPDSFAFSGLRAVGPELDTIISVIQVLSTLLVTKYVIILLENDYFKVHIQVSSKSKKREEKPSINTDLHQLTFLRDLPSLSVWRQKQAADSSWVTTYMMWQSTRKS